MQFSFLFLAHDIKSSDYTANLEMISIELRAINYFFLDFMGIPNIYLLINCVIV